VRFAVGDHPPVGRRAYGRDERVVGGEPIIDQGPTTGDELPRGFGERSAGPPRREIECREVRPRGDREVVAPRHRGGRGRVEAADGGEHGVPFGVRRERPGRVRGDVEECVHRDGVAAGEHRHVPARRAGAGSVHELEPAVAQGRGRRQRPLQVGLRPGLVDVDEPAIARPVVVGAEADGQVAQRGRDAPVGRERPGDLGAVEVLRLGVHGGIVALTSVTGGS
jgi:hypothetical protein